MKGHYFQLSLSVSLCVCLSVRLWPALLPFNVNWFWRNLVTRTLLWSSLAATIMVQIGCRGTAKRLFENFKKFSKITEFEFQNSGRSFFAPVSPVYCKKFWLDSNKTDREDTFWSLPLWRFRQWHCCSSTTLAEIVIELAAWRRAAIKAWGHSELRAFGTGGIQNWVRNQAVKTHRLICLSVPRCIPTLLHGPRCNLGEW